MGALAVAMLAAAVALWFATRGSAGSADRAAADRSTSTASPTPSARADRAAAGVESREPGRAMVATNAVVASDGGVAGSHDDVYQHGAVVTPRVREIEKS